MPQLAVAAWAAFSTAAAAASASIATALTAAGVGAGLAGTIGVIGGFVSTASNVIGGVMAVGSALGVGQKQPSLRGVWEQNRLTVDASASRKLIVGRTVISGSLRAQFQVGKYKDWFWQTIALGGAGPIESLDGVVIERVSYSINGNGQCSYAPNDMQVFFRDGAWAQSAITSFPLRNSSETPIGQWTASHRGAGIAHVLWVARENPKVFTKGKPQPLWLVKGQTDLIDPRTGTTAGSTHRDNPAVWEYTWRLGFKSPAGYGTVELGGFQKTVDQLDTATYAAWANRCESLGWKVSGEIDLNEDREAVSRAFCQAGAAVPVVKGGKDSVFYQSVKTSLMTLTETDFVGEVEVVTSPEIRDRSNGIVPRFRSEAHGWEQVAGSLITASSYVTEDGGSRITEVNFPLVVSATQAGQLAAYQMVQSRERLLIRGPIHPRILAVGPGEAVTINVPSRGISSVKFIMEGRTIGTDGAITCSFRSETDSKHTYATGESSTVPDTSLPSLSDGTIDSPTAGVWTAAVAQITSGASSLPIIRVTGAVESFRVAAILIRYRVTSGPGPWNNLAPANRDATRIEIDTVTPNTSYDLEVSYISVTGKESAWTSLGTVSTGVMISASTGAVEPGAVRVGTDIFPGSGSTPLPGTQLLNDQIGIDENGRLTNTGTGTAVVGNAQITIDANGRLTTTGTGTAIVDNGRITIDANGRLTTTGTGSVVVDNSKITLGTLGFTGATDATRNVVSTGLLAARPTGSDGDIFFATDDNNGAGLVYTKIAGAWVADPKAKVLFDDLTTTVNNNEATNSSFRSSQTTTNSATSTSLSTLSAKFTADQQADYLLNGQFLRGTNGWTQISGGGGVTPQTPEGLSGRNGVHIAAASGAGTQYYGTEFAFPTWRTLDLAWSGITTLWSGGTNTGASIKVYLQGKVGAGAYATIASTANFTDIDSMTTPKTLRATAAAGYDTIRLLFEINPPSSGSTLGFILTQKITQWTGEFPSLDAGPRAVLGTEARIATEETARATADSALASRSTTLEAVVRFPTPNAINKNPNFGSWSGTLPDDWADWVNGTANITKTTGDLSPFAYRQTNPAGAVNYGMTTTLNGRMSQGWHVLEAEVTLNSGALWGGSVHLNWGVSEITNSETIHFAADADITGSVVGAGTVGRRYRFSKLLNIAVVPNLCNIYLMTSWEGTSNTGNAKDLTWHKCLIRPASDSEIELRAARNGAASVGARIATEETTRASADSALAVRATTLEATVNDGTTGVAATAARLTTEEGTRATADSALAGRATTLEAVARTRGDSILPDPNMRDISWWANGVSGVQLIDDSTGWARSRLMQIARNGDFDFSTPFFPVQLGATYRVRVRIWNNNAGWTGAFWPLIHIPNSAWYSLKHGNPVNPDIADAGNAIIANGDTSELEWTITNTAASANANREWQFRFKGQGVSSASPIFLNVEIIQLTGWTETQTNLARIITEESTRAFADSGLASRTDVVEAVVSVGSPSANLVPNSFLVNLDGYEWTPAGTGPFNRGLNLSGWSSATNPTGYIQVARATAVGSETVIDERSPRFRVSPSQNYGFAARLAPHRATASIRLEFLDASGAFINNTSLITGGTNGGASNGDPSTFTTIGDFGTAPSNAVFGHVVIRLAGNGQGDPYVFWQAMDCFKASQGQTTLRPYQDGVPLDRTARIEAEESARASGDAANALSIQTVSARVDGRPNLFPYPQPISNRTPTQQGWLGTEVSALFSGNLGGMVYYRARSGGSAVTEFYYFNLPDTYYIDANNQYTLSANGYAGASSNTVGDRLFMYIEVLSADLSTILYGTSGVNLNSSTTRYTQTTNYTGTPISGRLRVVFAREFAASGSYQDAVFSNIKLEAGTLATAPTNTAQVQVSAQAIATLNDSAAFYQILVAASGGDPAIVRLFSGQGGSEVAIAAKIISLINTSSGVSMPVMRATGGEAFFQRPISSDFGSRRVTIGPGYGVSGSEVVLWFGPSTIAPASQSRTNCIFALGTDGIVYYGGTDLQVGGMQGTLNLYNVNLTRSGSGATVQSMTATGFAPGTISYLWELLSGDAVNIGSATSATTNIGHSLTIGETKTSVVKCTMTSSAGPSTFRLLNISSSEIS